MSLKHHRKQKSAQDLSISEIRENLDFLASNEDVAGSQLTLTDCCSLWYRCTSSWMLRAKAQDRYNRRWAPTFSIHTSNRNRQYHYGFPKWGGNASWPWAGLLMSQRCFLHRRGQNPGTNLWGSSALRFGTQKNWGSWVKIQHCKGSQKVHGRAMDLNTSI